MAATQQAGISVSQYFPDTTAARTHKPSSRVKAALAALSLGLSVGMVALWSAFFLPDNDATQAGLYGAKRIRVAEIAAPAPRPRSPTYNRALPNVFDGWDRIDYIGGDAVGMGFDELVHLLPVEDIARFRKLYTGKGVSAAVYRRGDDLFMVLVDPYCKRVRQARERGVVTTIAGVDFFALGAVGDANMNLVTEYEGSVALAIIGKASAPTVEHLLSRANLAVLSG